MSVCALLKETIAPMCLQFKCVTVQVELSLHRWVGIVARLGVATTGVWNTCMPCQTTGIRHYTTYRRTQSLSMTLQSRKLIYTFSALRPLAVQCARSSTADSPHTHRCMHAHTPHTTHTIPHYTNTHTASPWPVHWRPSPRCQPTLLRSQRTHCRPPGSGQTWQRSCCHQCEQCPWHASQSNPLRCSSLWRSCPLLQQWCWRRRGTVAMGYINYVCLCLPHAANTSLSPTQSDQLTQHIDTGVSTHCLPTHHTEMAWIAGTGGAHGCISHSWQHSCAIKLKMLHGAATNICTMHRGIMCT